MRVALRISDEKLSALTYNGSLPTAQQRLFNPISLLRPKIESIEEKGRLNNGRNYSHLLHIQRQHEIVISSDELDDERFTFLESFWIAPYKYLSTNNGTSWSNYVEVFTESGEFPVEFIEGIEYLPEVKLLLKEKYPVG